MRDLLRFGLVGIIGFITDAGLLLALVQWLEVKPQNARLFSFIGAASVTYFLNSRFTFSSARRGGDVWLRYLVATSIGAGINIGTYQIWIHHFGIAAAQLLAGTAVGSIAALAFNYRVSRRLVFTQVK